MARLKGKSIMNGVSGMVGKQVIFRTLRGKTVVSNRPTNNKSKARKMNPSTRQFKRAQKYAKIRMQDPEFKALYSKGVTSTLTSAYLVAGVDFLNPPVIHYIKVLAYSGAIGSVVTIKATDDFRVESVHLTITDGVGKVLETSPATVYRLKPFIWKYQTTVLNRGTIITR